MKENPIIILIGLERSGTTWIGKILDSHPYTRYLHEPDRLKNIGALPEIVTMNQHSKYIRDIEDFVNNFPAINNVRVVGKLPLFSKTYQSSLEHNLTKISVHLSKATLRLGLKRSLPVRNNFRRNPQMLYVWKSISSVGRIGVLAKALPNCKGVFLMRHPCGQVASIVTGSQKNKFSFKTPISEKYGIFQMIIESEPAKNHDLTVDYIKTLTPVERLAWRWVLFNEKAMREIDGLKNWRVVLYDDFTVNPQDSARRLFEFLDLDWNKQTQSFIHQSTISNSSNYYSVYKNPEEASNKWKKLLSKDEIQRIDAIIKKSLLCRLFKIDV